MIDRHQSRAARALLEWTQEQLAEAAGVSSLTIRRFEQGKANPRRALVSALEKAFLDVEIVFLPNSGVAFHPDRKA